MSLDSGFPAAHSSAVRRFWATISYRVIIYREAWAGNVPLVRYRGAGVPVSDESASLPLSFSVIGGGQVHQILQGRETRVIRLVEHAYRLHGTNAAVNPPSYFLRIPDKPDARIIALPASVRGDIQADGIKWISSFPGNIESGLPRASAVLILNDSRNGYPIACLEASIISACRTAASAALAPTCSPATGAGRPPSASSVPA